MTEEPAGDRPPIGRGAKAPKGRKVELSSLSGQDTEPARLISGISELDRVLGGGLVAGSATLLGGDPGIGKSTLLLQAAASMARKELRTVYVSGEEALAQLRMRAARLKLAQAPVELAAETNIADIRKTLESAGDVGLVIIDSIQTMWSPAIEAAPGTVSQVRVSGQELIHFAKANDVAVILVGHVTKDGQIAGPRVLEHMVDTVVYFEGDRGDQFRILRAIKNRFGPAHEIGVFEMREEGLAEVQNPSALFLEARDESVPGAAVFAGIEGTRPVLVEIQALAALIAGDAAARDCRLGQRAPVDGSRRFGGALWHGIWRTRRVFECCRRLAHQRTGGGFGRGGGSHFVNVRQALAPPVRSVRRNQLVRCRAAGQPERLATEGSRQAGLSAGFCSDGRQCGHAG